MFTRKRRDYRSFIFISVIAVLCLLIIVIAWPSDPEIKNGDATGAKANSRQLSEEDFHGERSEQEQQEDEEALGEDDTSDADITDDDISEDDISEEDNFPPEQKDNISGGSESYYLVKKAGDVIKVFFVDHSGNELELETTDIMYEMLSYDDQVLFEKGYIVKNQEELAVLLQDFES